MLKVYSKTNCSACDKAKALLKRYNVPYDELLIDMDNDAKEFVLSEGHRQVPQLYYKDKLFVIGGYLGLMKMTESEIKTILYGTLKSN
jgi:glutaredoxin